MYNKEIHRTVVGATNVNSLLDAFKSAQMNLLKLKKYKGLVSDDKHRHTVHAVNQITSKGLDLTDADMLLAQMDGYGQKYFPSTNSDSKQVSYQQQQTQRYGNPYQQLQPHFAPCYTCCVYGYLSKNCQHGAFIQQNYLRNTTLVATPPYLSRPNTHLGFPQAFLPNSSPRLAQQLTTDYTLNPHVCNETADKMAEEKKLIKQAVLGTYEKMKGKYPISRNKNQNNPKDDSGKQISQSSKKSVQFKSNTSTGTSHSSVVTCSGNATHSVLELNPSLVTTTNPVSTIAEETESQLDT